VKKDYHKEQQANQGDFHARLEGLHHRVVVARCLDDVLAALYLVTVGPSTSATQAFTYLVIAAVVVALSRPACCARGSSSASMSCVT
jgi:hypothetical protein